MRRWPRSTISLAIRALEDGLQLTAQMELLESPARGNKKNILFNSSSML